MTCKRSRTMALTTLSTRILRFTGEIHAPHVIRRVPRSFRSRQTCGQSLEQLRKPPLIVAPICKIIRAAFHPSESDIQIGTMLSNKPVFQFSLKDFHDPLRFIRVRYEHVRMASTRVEDIRTIKTEPFHELVNDMLHHQLKIKTTGAQLLQGPRTADAVNEILNATHVARNEKEQGLRIKRVRCLSRKKCFTIVGNIMGRKIVIDTRSKSRGSFSMVVQRNVD